MSGMTEGSEAVAMPPCALLVMCNECGCGVEMLLPIDHARFCSFLGSALMVRGDPHFARTNTNLVQCSL